MSKVSGRSRAAVLLSAWGGDGLAALRALATGAGCGEKPSSMTRTRCPVSWSRMRYSSGEDTEDSAGFWIRPLGAKNLSPTRRRTTRLPLRAAGFVQRRYWAPVSGCAQFHKRVPSFGVTTAYDWPLDPDKSTTP